MEKDKDKKMTLGIGSLTNLVKEIREDVPKNPITINEIQIVKSGRIFAQLLISTERVLPKR